MKVYNIPQLTASFLFYPKKKKKKKKKNVSALNTPEMGHQNYIIMYYYYIKYINMMVNINYYDSFLSAMRKGGNCLTKVCW